MLLKMSSQAARIGLNISKPSMSLTSTQAQITMETAPSRLEITSTSPRIQIDQSQCFADEDHRNITDFMQYWSDYSRSQLAQGIDRIVSNGNNLAAIQTDFSIPEMAAQASEEQADFEIVAVPSELPRISVDMQPVSYQFTPTELRMDVKPGQVNNQFQWGKVDTYVAQPNSLDIQWIDDRQVDIKV